MEWETLEHCKVVICQRNLCESRLYSFLHCQTLELNHLLVLKQIKCVSAVYLKDGTGNP